MLKDFRTIFYWCSLMIPINDKLYSNGVAFNNIIVSSILTKDCFNHYRDMEGTQ